jgi:hypothetical protein
MKYVIVEKMGIEVPLMFPDCVPHETFADMKPVSAAKFFVSVDSKDNKVYTTYGESTSLKLKPRPEDADIIQHAFEFEE